MPEYFRLSDRISGHRNEHDDTTTLTLDGAQIPQLIQLDGRDWSDDQLARIASAVIGVREEWQLRGHMAGRREKLTEMRAVLELN
ncbi:hypothetical protein [Pseudomonas protegens]|uniref:hypothetical protein n=1 Tax=Pseudomonas protegens TaxID=380021 RepID=UPI001B31D7A6|nr:hypothetical protein [Pseudomonas protegens]